MKFHRFDTAKLLHIFISVDENIAAQMKPQNIGGYQVNMLSSLSNEVTFIEVISVNEIVFGVQLLRTKGQEQPKLKHGRHL